jgi:MFS family permease
MTWPRMPFLATRGLQFSLLIVAATAGVYARTAISPLQETMHLALHLSDNDMALLQGPALALPVVVAALPLGLAIDRYSRVRLLQLFAGIDILGSLLTAVASHFVVLFLARCLIGLAATATSTTAYSLLADLFVPAQRGRASMMVAIGQFAGMSAAFALGGMLLAEYGSAPEAWRRSMLWLTVSLIPIIALMLAMREPARSGCAIDSPSARDTGMELWRYRAVITPLLVGVVMAEIAVMAVLIWASPTLSRHFSLAPDRIGVIMATGLLISGILGPVLGGVLADLCQRTGGPRRTLAVLGGLSILSAPAGLFSIMPTVGSASVLLVILLTVIGAILVTGTALFTIVIPNELRGLCMALLAATSVLFGVAFAPLAVSSLSTAIGGAPMIGQALAWVSVTASAIAAVAFLSGIRFLPRLTPL